MSTLTDVVIGSTASVAGFLTETYSPYLTGNYISPEIIRDVDHVIAGVGLPFLMKLLYKLPKKLGLDRTPNEFLTYASLCVYWETKQFFQRGYFQYDQLICDAIGIGIGYTLEKIIDMNNAKKINKTIVQNLSDKKISH